MSEKSYRAVRGTQAWEFLHKWVAGEENREFRVNVQSSNLHVTLGQFHLGEWHYQRFAVSQREMRQARSDHQAPAGRGDAFLLHAQTAAVALRRYITFAGGIDEGADQSEAVQRGDPGRQVHGQR